MLTEEAVASAASQVGPDVRAHFVSVTPSTNSELLALAAQGAPEWTVVVAAHQKAGRGRLGRRWVDTPGASLPVSLLLRPPVTPQEASLLSLAAAVSMARACEETCVVEARCKWPNDLVVEGRKLAGILTEGKVEADRLLFVVVGTGLNVGQRPEDFPADVRDSATSLAIEGCRPEMAHVLRAYLSHFRKLYRHPWAEFRQAVVDAYRPLCATIGRRVRATTVTGTQVEGRAVAVGEAGELKIETAAAVETVLFGDVAHLDQ